jgi:hypothetical protein
MGKDFGGLLSAERANYYRALANDAIQKAQAASEPGRRAECVSQASGWHALAMEAERAVGKSFPGCN